MKRLFATALIALSSIAFGATLTPIQLLNPAGSTSGQFIQSTGPSSAPAWGNLSAAALTGIVPVANGGTAASTLTAHGVLLGQGTSAVTAAAPGASGTLLTSNGAGADPTFQALTISSITGVTNGSNAAAGTIGEYIENSASLGCQVSGTPGNVISISLTAGDWDVVGNILYTAGTGTTIVNGLSAVNTASATLPAAPDYGFMNGVSVTAGNAASVAAPMRRINITSNTTVFLVTDAVYSGSVCTANGKIRARRVR